MGNAMKVRLKEDREALAVTEELVQDFQSYINVVDHSTEGLAKSVDSMRTACEMLLQQLDNKEPQVQDIGDDSGSTKGTTLARHLLETIDSSVSDHKFVLIESLSKLFHFLVNVSKSYTIPSEDMEFLVDRYRTQNTAIDMEDGMTYYDVRIRSLQKEIKYLQDANCAAKKEIRALNEREISYIEEINLLEIQVESNKKKIEDLIEKRKSEGETAAYDKCEDLHSDHATRKNGRFEGKDVQHELINLRQTNETLNKEVEKAQTDLMTVKNVNEDALKLKSKEIESLKQELQRITNESSHKTRSVEDKETSTEYLEERTNERESVETKLNEQIITLKTKLDFLENSKVVQVLEYESTTTPSYGFGSYDYKNDLYRMIQSEMALCNIDLKITMWHASKLVGMTVDKTIIIPIAITYTGSVKNKMHSALKDVTVTPNIAVLLFYYFGNPQVCKEVNEPVEERFENLGGIFKFGFSFCLRQKVTETNKTSFNALVQFLKCDKSEPRYLSR